MKEYWSIPGWKNAPRGLPCIAFDKLDGSNIRAEWSKKAGFYKYGSRSVLLDKGHEFLGEAIPLFEKTLAEQIDKVFRESKLPSFDKAIVFMEFYGPNSAFGQHVPNDPKTLTIIDVNLHKRGIVLPRDFIKYFGHLPIPKVVYEGNFNQPFIQDVQNGVYGEGEGVVVKGVNPNAKKEQHGLWFAKVKTKAWMMKLRDFAANNTNLARLYEDNLREQGDVEVDSVSVDA